MEINKNINCCVTSCSHNCKGKNCQLKCIKISDNCKEGTCCDSFECKK